MYVHSNENTRTVPRESPQLRQKLGLGKTNVLGGAGYWLRQTDETDCMRGCPCGWVAGDW